ncbi:zymogen granule membrane protein 16 [Salmo salar]|uniref:Zymogen granule membrane protein 16 n=2 Tax=Bilateria TaxID=33213 RepID=C1BME4_CALRO|nr:zymogen granule membrane protein 16-like [Salmo salar]XP_014039353.1 zymogen granule membrane protein 16-like [Salmo salar]XP_045553826.1 zymogen granule membrane protein 16-like [Salmo salar]ACO10197.1 Zymogen granule membrane protein 16 precursor [Caligus rogercresseyi]|eukprot:XP_014039352.1 PREDICTED: zymogen granule membrane protein 16-like [Salmo salar]
MFSILVVTVFLASCLAMPIKDPYSYSSAVGQGGGTPFASYGEGRITAVRVWETNNNNYYYYYYNSNSNAYISGFQLRYSSTWSPVFGGEWGEKQEMELFNDEAIVEVSGKYNPADYICYLVLTTNMGRTLSAGQPSQVSFNFYSANMGNELRLLSGRFNGAGITSIGAHWGLVYMEGAGNSTLETALETVTPII